jgi:hypothetical protein
VTVHSAETVVRIDSTALRRARLTTGLSRMALARQAHARPGQVRWWEQRSCWVALHRVRWLAEALGTVDILELVADGTPVSLGILVARGGLPPAEVAARLGISLARWHDVLRGRPALNTRQVRLLGLLLDAGSDQIWAAMHTVPETRPVTVELTDEVASWLAEQRNGESITDSVLRLLQADSPQRGGAR